MISEIDRYVHVIAEISILALSQCPNIFKKITQSHLVIKKLQCAHEMVSKRIIHSERHLAQQYKS